MAATEKNNTTKQLPNLSARGAPLFSPDNRPICVDSALFLKTWVSQPRVVTDLDMSLDELEKVCYLGSVREASLDGTHYVKREGVLSRRQESYCEVALA